MYHTPPNFNFDRPEVSQITTWERIENYQGPAIRTQDTRGLFRQIRSLFGGSRRNISRYRSSARPKQVWRTHLKKAA